MAQSARNARLRLLLRSAHGAALLLSALIVRRGGPLRDEGTVMRLI